MSEKAAENRVKGKAMDKPVSSKQKNPVKAIRAYCLNCCLESANEVALCTADECELYEFRMGKNPYRKERTEAQKEAARKAAAANFGRKTSVIYRDPEEEHGAAI